MEQTMPTRWSTAIFNTKALLLRVRRLAHDIRDGVHGWPVADSRDYPVLLAESRTPLWASVSVHDLPLQRGKVQNLRTAARRIDGVAVPADGLWSFWKHVGRATAARGYATGRMLREGCVIPTIGGGICQLSNALYEVALKAGCEIVERHRHSQILPGSAAAAGRDATVVWNYIDLRFRPTQDVRLSVTLTPRELVVRLHGRSAAAPREGRDEAAPRRKLSASPGECASCGEVRCFLNQPPSATRTDETHTAFLLDEAWPELAAYVEQTRTAADRVCVPVDGIRWNLPQYAWPAPDVQAPLEVLMRSLRSRRLGRYGARRLQHELDAARRLARALGRHLTPDTTHLVVSQSLLPFLQLDGVLGGRSYDVLLTRMPLHDLHRTLDAAREATPEAQTLSEYRAPHDVVEAERRALADARRVVTPHRAHAARFGARAHLVEWARPQVPSSPSVRAVGFAGPTAARKGAYALREALRGLDLELWISGAMVEPADFWEGIRVRRVTREELVRCETVVAPSLLEDQPRALLAALAAGRRVVATAACGLEPHERLVEVPFGDVAALRDALTTSAG